MRHNMPAYAQHLFKLTAAIRDPEALDIDIEPRRLAVYQRLFFNNINNFVSSAFPVFKQLMPEEWWLNEIRGFMRNYRCQSPRFYDIAEQFIDYIRSDVRPTNEIDPPFMHELMQYEWLELYLELAEGAFSAGELPLLDSGVEVSPLSLLQGYQYPVHLINKGNQLTTPSPQLTWLLVYRDTRDKINFEHLSPFSAQLFMLMQESSDVSLASLLRQIAHNFGLEVSDEYLAQGLALATDWHQRDVLKRYLGGVQ